MLLQFLRSLDLLSILVNEFLRFESKDNESELDVSDWFSTTYFLDCKLLLSSILDQKSNKYKFLLPINLKLFYHLHIIQNLYLLQILDTESLH